MQALQLSLLATAALGAGLVDAIAGGGGLILVPALFSIFPAAAPATLFGTNKGGACWGTAAAAWHYARRVRTPWRALLPAAIAAFIGAMAGAWTVTLVDSAAFRRALPLVLAALLLYTLTRRDLGLRHAPRLSGGVERAAALAGGGTIGFYDGFFGPGTGNFLIFLFVRGFGFDFLHASACAKIVNVACNASAMILFAAKGHVMWGDAALIAGFNIAGNVTGSRLALRGGARLVRWTFVGVVVALIVKTGIDAARI